MERHALRSAFDPPVRRLGFQKQKAVAIGIIRLKLIIPQLPQKVKGADRSSGGRLVSFADCFEGASHIVWLRADKVAGEIKNNCKQSRQVQQTPSDH